MSTTEYPPGYDEPVPPFPCVRILLEHDPVTGRPALSVDGQPVEIAQGANPHQLGITAAAATAAHLGRPIRVIASAGGVDWPLIVRPDGSTTAPPPPRSGFPGRATRRRLPAGVGVGVTGLILLLALGAGSMLISPTAHHRATDRSGAIGTEPTHRPPPRATIPTPIPASTPPTPPPASTAPSPNPTPPGGAPSSNSPPTSTPPAGASAADPGPGPTISFSTPRPHATPRTSTRPRPHPTPTHSPTPDQAPDDNPDTSTTLAPTLTPAPAGSLYRDRWGHCLTASTDNTVYTTTCAGFAAQRWVMNPSDQLTLAGRCLILYLREPRLGGCDNAASSWALNGGQFRNITANLCLEPTSNNAPSPLTAIQCTTH